MKSKTSAGANVWALAIGWSIGDLIWAAVVDRNWHDAGHDIILLFFFALSCDVIRRFHNVL